MKSLAKPEHPASRRRHAFPELPVVRPRAGDRLHGLLLVSFPPADKDGIAPGGNGPNRGIADRETVRDRLHLHCVGKHHAAEAQLVAKETPEDLFRQRGGELAIQRGVEHMGGHERGNPCTNGATERVEVPPAERVPGAAYYGKHLVGICRGTAVPREVLPDRDHPPGENASEKGDPEAGGLRRIVRQCPVPDHRVFRVAVHIQDRGEVDIDPHGAQLFRHHFGGSLRRALRMAA